MKKYFLYLIIYSIGGFILERIINLIFLGEYYDNSVLFGPWQPLYGAGILGALIIYDLFLYKIEHTFIKYSLLLLVSIITTGLSEAITGYGYEFLYGSGLWDYGMTFTCNLEYVCALPTSMFGVMSFMVILFIHPYIKSLIDGLQKHIFILIFRFLLLIFLVDIIYTFVYRLA